MPSTENKDANSSKPVDLPIDKARSTFAQKSNEFPAYTFAQRQGFITEMEALAADFTLQLDELSESVAKSGAVVNADAEPRITELEVKRTIIDQQLEEIKNCDATTWDLTKATTAQAEKT